MDGVEWCRVEWYSMDGCWVDGSRLVSWSWVCHTLILDISNITTISHSISMVVNNLDAAVGQGHPVVSGHSCPIRSLVLAKVSTRVLILNTILKSIGLGWLSVSVSWGMDWSMDNGSCMHDGSVHYGSRMNWGRVENWRWVEGGGTSRGHGGDEGSSL